MIDNKALRVSTARRMLIKANELLDQMDQPHIVFNIGGKDNIYTEQLMDRPPTVDLRNLMITAATALDKHLVLEKHDAGAGTDADHAVSAIGQIGEALTAAARILDSGDDGGS